MVLVACPPRRHTTLLNTLLLYLQSLGLAWAITDGPLATVSLQSEIYYQTARFCAAECLVYHGVDTCSTGPALYNDVGVFLGCRKCAPINACYCAPRYGTSVTSFMSSCVSLQCGASVQDWLDEATSMLSIYDGYCATANVIPTTTAMTSRDTPTMTTTPTPAPKRPALDTTSTTTPPLLGLILSTTTTMEVTTTVGAATRSIPDTTVETRGTATTTTAGDILPSIPLDLPDADDEQEGLSQSDIVALAASLCIGVPSIIIAVATLWIQLRRRQRRRETFLPPPRPPRVSPSAEDLLPQPGGALGHAPVYNCIGGGQGHEVHELDTMRDGPQNGATQQLR